MRVTPEGARIRISQIRDICHNLSMRPYEARYRLTVVEDAQTMTTEAGNAFLKVLEEPPDRSVLILIATDASALLPTIASRCHHIRFRPLAAERIAEMVAAETGLDPQQSMVIGTMAAGSYTRAMAMTSDDPAGGWLPFRNWVVSELALLAQRPIPVVLGFADALARRKDRISDALQIIASWYRDMIVGKYDTDGLINRDLGGTVLKASRTVSEAEALSAMAAVQAAEKQIQQNANPRLALEAMMLKLAGQASDEKSGRKIQTCG